MTATLGDLVRLDAGRWAAFVETAPGEWVLKVTRGGGCECYAVREGRHSAAAEGIRSFMLMPSDPRCGSRVGVVACGGRAFCSCRVRGCDHEAAIEAILKGEQG